MSEFGDFFLEQQYTSVAGLGDKLGESSGVIEREKVPNRTTLWLFRERLTEKGMFHLIWEELRRQLDDKEYRIKRGSIQDAKIISVAPGHGKADTL